MGVGGCNYYFFLIFISLPYTCVALLPIKLIVYQSHRLLLVHHILNFTFAQLVYMWLWDLEKVFSCIPLSCRGAFRVWGSGPLVAGY